MSFVILVRLICACNCCELSCPNLCSHMYKGSCSDVSGLCKHIHKVHSLRFRIDVTAVTKEISDNDNTSVIFYKQHCSSTSIVDIANTVKLAELVKAKLERLAMLIDGDMVRHMLLLHIDGIVSNLFKQCDALTAQNTCQIPQNGQVSIVFIQSKTWKTKYA